MRDDTVTGEVIGAAMVVHRSLGPGLLESAYDACLALEMGRRGLAFERQRRVPLEFLGRQVEDAYRVDFVVESELIVELKSVDSLAPIHTAQLLTYLRLTGLPLGLLINFNVILLKHGVRRVILSPAGGSQRRSPRTPRPPR